MPKMLPKTKRAVKSRMLHNRLELNDSKTEVVTLKSRHRPNHEAVSMAIGHESMKSSSKVCDLGVILNQHLTLEQHVNSVYRPA